MWELVTREEPHHGVPPFQVVFAVGTQGIRPTVPSSCPANIAKLIEEAWAENPDERVRLLLSSSYSFSSLFLVLQVLFVDWMIAALIRRFSEKIGTNVGGLCCINKYQPPLCTIHCLFGLMIVLRFTTTQVKKQCREAKERSRMLPQRKRKQIGEMKQEIKQLEQSKLCKICEESDLQIEVLPRKHICLCQPCAQKPKECPVCRTAIKRQKKIFLS